MGTYRVEWPCCGSATETEAWEPEQCPFCEPDNAANDPADPALLALAVAARDLAERLVTVHDDGQYRAVWEYSQMMRGAYRGPRYADELDAVLAALEPIAALLAPDGAASEGVDA